MKTKILFTVLATFIFYSVPAQVPQGFNYQAIALDGIGNPIKNNNTLQVKIGILSDTITPVIVWEELHNPVKTDAFGVFALIIGSGVRQSGSSLTFNAIDWTTTPLFLKIQIYYQNTWKYMGSARLWSVPYSMISGGLEGAVNKLAVVGDDPQSDKALFEVKRKDGETIFAVYNHGVRVFMPLDTLSKARKGGFAIGGFDKTKGIIRDYFVVNPDSIRAYIDTDPAKAGKGGFAIGGFDRTKAANEEYLRVTRDSTRVYVSNDQVKSSKGGFAIGGFDKTKGTITPFVNLTPLNYFIGHESGLNITSGLYNSFVGYQAGKSNTLGSSNIFIGYQSGYSNKLGDDNTFVGYQAGFNNIGNDIGGVQQHGDYNCYFGYQSGYSSLQGDFNTMIGYNSGRNNLASLNTFIGFEAGFSNTEGAYNTFMGVSAGTRNLDGRGNIFIGHQAGYNNYNGDNNISIGSVSGAAIQSGYNNVILGDGAVSGTVYSENGTGSSNVIIGYEAGKYAKNGSSNIFIGNQAGYNETGSNLLYIENSSSVTPLVYANFSTNVFRINGNIEYTGTIGTPSDVRLKKNITGLQNTLKKLTRIRGVYFNWDQNIDSAILLPEGRQIGVIAQEVEKEFPELVITNDRGHKIVDYTKLSPVIIEAIRDQQKQIEEQKQQIDIQWKEINDLKALLNSIINDQKIQGNN